MAPLCVGWRQELDAISEKSLGVAYEEKPMTSSGLQQADDYPQQNTAKRL